MSRNTGGEDPEVLLRAHRIGNIDVDWLINARSLNNEGPGLLSTKKQNAENETRPKEMDRSSSSELPPDDPASPLHINAKLPPQQRATEEQRGRERRNSAIGLSETTAPDDSSTDLRRTKSLSAALPGEVSKGPKDRFRRKSVSSGIESPKKESKLGFFKSLFFGGRKKKPSVASPTPPSPSPRQAAKGSSYGRSGTAPSSRRSSVTSITSGFPLTRSRTYSYANQNRGNEIFHNNNRSHAESWNDSSERISRVKTQGATPSEIYGGRDPRLMEFLRYYKAHGYPASAFLKRNDYDDMEIGAKPAGPGAKFKFGGNTDTDDSENLSMGGAVKCDVKGRPLPLHPRKSNLPPALKSSRLGHNGGSQSEVNSDSDSESSGSAPHRFGSFLRRVTSQGGTSPATRSLSPTRFSQPYHHSFDPSKVKTVPGLENIEPLKHVSFASNTYFNDPPQQICSKHPRRGEVEVRSNGSVVIHRLSPEERRRVLENSSAGVVVGGSGQLKLLSQKTDEDGEDPRKMEEMAPRKMMSGEKLEEDEESVDGEDSDDKEDHTVQHRNIRKAAAEAAAEARGKEEAANNDEEVGVSHMAKRVTIDKPMVSRRYNSSLSLSSVSSVNSAESDDEILPPPRAKIPLDVVYTRCCHLREILPIPATLKQLTPGSTDPIPLLQLRNPRPSMVEVWSFSDFLSVAPVLCLSLDGVSLSLDMFKIILSSVLGKKGFEKLSLRNTPIDEKGWQLLCYFVSKSKDLSALDLTMVPDIKTNVQKPSRSSLKSTIVRMKSNDANRSDMNWDLLAASVAAKGGLEEVVISGAQMPPEQFENFIDVACIDTKRLGLAYNKLTKGQCRSLSRWLVQSKVGGLDLGFNDLSDKLSSLNDAIWEKVNNTQEKNLFRYISLNCTGLTVDANDISKTNEVLKLISFLCYCKDLRFLDISNNPKMFPHCINTLIDCLPACVSLTRLHLDYESLAPTSVVTLAEALPLCRRLNYLSMLGTEFDLASYKALADAVRKSPSLITLDVDYKDMPRNIREKVSLYTMKNVDTELNRVRSNSDKSQPYSLQEELSKLLTERVENGGLYNASVQKYAQKVAVTRQKIGKVVKDLFAIRINGQLSVEGKETLIRLCFVDASLQKRLNLLEQRNKSIHKYQNDRHPAATHSHIQSSMRKPDFSFSSTGGVNHMGHSALLPFGRAEVESEHEQTPQADDTVQLVERDGYNHELDKEQLVEAAKSLDTDKIKDYLMRSDVAEMVSVIDELHSQGYHLHDIFKKSSNDSPEFESLSKTLSPPVEYEGSSSTSNGSYGRTLDRGRVPLVSQPSTDSMRADRAENEALDAAYDDVLDNLQRERG